MTVKLASLEGLITSNCDVSAKVLFDSDINHTCTIGSPLELSLDVDKMWHQIGTVAEMCVVQLGLEKTDGAWSITKGFISLPVNHEIE